MLSRFPHFFLISAFIFTAACATAPSADEAPTGQLQVHSLIGEELLVDGGTVARADVDDKLEVPVGTRAVQVRIDDTWTDPVMVGVKAGETSAVDIPWEMLPVQQYEEIPVAAVDRETFEQMQQSSPEPPSGDMHDMLGEVEMKQFSEPGEAVRDAFDVFAEVIPGDETPAGAPLVFERAQALAGQYGFQFQSGDQLYEVEGQPVENLDQLIDVLTEVSLNQGVRTITFLRDGEKWRYEYVPRLVEELQTSLQQHLSDPELSETSDIDEGADGSGLTVYSRPRGTVFVDGEATGEVTPTTLALDPGTYSVTVQFDEEERSEEKQVRVPDDERVKVLFRQ